MRLCLKLGFMCLSREDGNPKPIIHRDSRFRGNDKTTFLTFERAWTKQ